ncbi:MAG: hypothetical protein IMY76_09485, partial [Chloroflexi bacterium]|nr:hypothetical protein [Chloroflexota bacterium]
YTSDDEPEQENATYVSAIPDWLAITEDQATSKVDPLKTDGVGESSEETAITSGYDKANLPDWLIIKDSSSQREATKEDDISDWLGSDEDNIPDSDVLPKWVGDDAREIEPSDKEQSTANNISPSSLPDWLEDIRPLNATSEEGDGTEDSIPAETSGPLAGLSGVLEAKPKIDDHVDKLPAFSSKLDVSDKQLESVSILDKLIKQESTAQPVPATPSMLTQRVFRWIIAALLIIVGSFAVISTGEPTAPLYQGKVPDEVISTSEQIFALSPKDKVLIAFDYEPSTSGELNTAAVPVLDHIMLEGAQMALISTSPTGPALAEQMLGTLLKEHHYLSGDQYINLGYIPGGATGLLGFTQIPQQITPISFDGKNAWQTRPLEEISTLSDFSLVVVITDNPDIARTWFEQIQPTLSGTPMVTIVSAQAEPILQPYYGDGGENAQIQGLVSGILGGAAYEKITGRPNLASQYWHALNLGLMISILIILLGSAVNTTTTILKRIRGKTPTRKAS